MLWIDTHKGIKMYKERRPHELYAKQDIYLFFLIEGLGGYLIPELVPCIRHLTFAPYEISGIVRASNTHNLLHPLNNLVRPIKLCSYSPLPIELLQSNFTLVLHPYNITITNNPNGSCPMMVEKQIPRKKLPLSCSWDCIEKAQLNHIIRCMLENTDQYLAVCGSSLK